MDYKSDIAVGKMIGTSDEARTKEIFRMVQKTSCKIVVRGCDPETREPRIAFFNGYFYDPNSSFIITSGHIVGFKGMVDARYEYWFIGNGAAAVDKVYAMEVVKSVPTATLLKPVAGEDGAEISLDRISYDTLVAVNTGMIAGTKVYIAAFLPTDKPTTIYSQGIVNCVSHGGGLFTTDASCDNGWSGAAVYTALGEFAGMVERAVGTTIIRTECISARDVDTFLTVFEPRLPGLYE